jgi:hypothetical protein
MTRLVRDHNNIELSISEGESPHVEGIYALSGAPLAADNRNYNLDPTIGGADRVRLNGLLKRHYGIYVPANCHVANVAEILAADTTL